MLEEYLKYANGMSASAEVLAWLEQTVGAALRKRKSVRQGDIEHIIDYLVSPAAPKRLLKMSIQQAKESSEKWSKTQQKKGHGLVDGDKDLSVVHEYADGSRIVKLISTNAYKREGFLMSHCLGGYSVKSDVEIYSYRDAKNNPHATFEIQRKGGDVSQIKGKGNGPIHPKYIMPILDFMESIGQKPRPSEMRNLGYYHIDKAHHEFVKSIIGAEKQLTVIHGELYVHS